MELIYPSYYKEFQCIASACPDSCCHEWDVSVDEESAERFRALPGPLGDILRGRMYEEDGGIYLRNQDGRCPMWRTDGLCALQAEHGHEALCQVCRQFPRISQDYGDFVEWGIEMSCPEAARIMLTADQWALTAETAPGGEEPDYDTGLMELLQMARPYAFELLRDRRLTVPQRLTCLLMYGHHVQSIIDGAEPGPFDRAAALVQAREFSAAGDGALLAEFYQGLEILTDRWRALLGRQVTPVWDEMLCNLAQYGIYRYFFQAVSDWDLICRIKMIVAGCILSAGLPGDRIGVIQLYAKEIENCDENLNAIWDGALCQAALTDANLLGLLGNNG